MAIHQAYARRERAAGRTRDVAVYADPACARQLTRFPPGVFQPRRRVRYMVIENASFEVQWLPDAKTDNAAGAAN